jgi:hypothetical protein
MSFPHRESTKILLGPVEAYAAAHRRTMKVMNSAAALSLKVANGLRNDTALRSLREGDTIVPSDLEAIIPGLADVQWTFDDSTNHYELWTVIDDLIVITRAVYMSNGNNENNLIYSYW